MSYRLYVIYFLITFPLYNLFGQVTQTLNLSCPRGEYKVLPGQIVNLAFFIENSLDSSQVVKAVFEVPEAWKVIPAMQKFDLKPLEKKLLIFSVQIPSNNPAGEFKLKLSAILNITSQALDSLLIKTIVGEVEKIELLQVTSPDYIWAGQESSSDYLVQNQGNVEKKVYLESINCQIDGPSEILIRPGESYRFRVMHKPSSELTETLRDFFTVRALVSGQVTKSIFTPLLIFPVKEKKTDFYRRFPVTASVTYLTSNQSGRFEHAGQLELSGSGFIDQEGKHKLEFLARGPNNTELSFLGLYDQYFISYQHDNLELSVGEKAYSFTPLTESSRFGLGGESKVKFNNGMNFGFTYVKPRFYENINYEMAAFTGFEFNRYNTVEIYFISKSPEFLTDAARMVSLNSKFQPIKQVSLEMEVSGGQFMNVWDNAFRGSINSQFSVFSLTGNYYYTGKNYPGYYSNSTFYSGNASLRLSQKINLTFYAREDFRNAQLDTFFVTAPYSNAFQSLFSYNIAPRTNLRLFWRKYERKDRLVFDKFHYQTSSFNAHINQQIRKLEYNLIAETGNTTNFLLSTNENRQTMYRGTVNLAYHFNALNALRIMGSYSNINNFISGEQNNLIAGFSLMNQISKKLRTHIHLQNAYSIEEYYRNRNLMQVNFEYTPNKMHKFSLRSFYTLFRQQTENPQLTLSFNYTFSFGIPLKKIITAGDLSGRITRTDGEPAEGIILTFLNKTTITDKNGQFSFKTVPAGRHFLFIDQSKVAIDEIPQIPNPIEIEIMEDKLETLNFRILKGGKVSGEFIVEHNSFRNSGNEKASAEHVVIELKGENELYRIESERDGTFSFPLVRPGEWSFKIYANSLPEGYEIEESATTLLLHEGQVQKLQIKLKPIKRTIIFKSGQNILQPLSKLKDERNADIETKEKKDESILRNEVYYSVQIGAFKNKLSTDSEYFKEKKYDFELESGKLYKYFVGKFKLWEEAVKEQERLKNYYKNSFVVKFENGQLIQNEKK